jgi:hypothetical protein
MVEMVLELVEKVQLVAKKKMTCTVRLVLDNFD